ncbi:MAG: insulinase family protein [Prolixibacteraceae bacterium]|nr:insulinase family protein [Prolixibacteraceae bacterium]
MKKLVYSLFILFLATTVNAQLDRSIRPNAGPAPKIQLGDYKLFTLDNGLKVIVVENHKIPKITYQLSLDIDPVLEENQAGYVAITGDLLRAGTTTKTKAEIDEAIDFIGASLNTFPTGISGSVLTKFSGDLLAIMSDVLYNPSFPAEELEKLKKQNISGIQTAKNDANSIANNINSAVIFGNKHPYGEINSEKTFESITLDKCKEYYKTYFRPNAAYLIIVGDITLKEAQSQAKQYFGKWEKGVVPTHKYNFPELNKSPRVVIGNRDGAVQSAIMVSYPLEFKPGNPDAIKASVMNSILGGGSLSSRINANLREKKAYTYGAYSSLNTDKLVGSFNASGEVKGEATDSAMVELLFEINRMITEPVDNKMLEQVKSRMNGSFARSLENPLTIAGFALNIEKYKLPKDYYTTYLEKLSKVSVADVQELAKKYLKPENANIIAVGNADQLQKTMAKFSKDGKVEQRDFYGNPLKAMEAPSNLTGMDVISKYVEAVGGKEKLVKVNDVTTKMGMEMQGMKIEIISKQKAPNKISVETLMGVNVLSKQVCNGVKAMVKSQMGNKELAGAELEEMLAQSTMNAELYLEKMGITAELKGSEDIDGQPAWKVQMNLPSGKNTVDFYDQKSGLKVKSIAQQGPVSVTTLYSDYRLVEGVLFPFKLKQSAGPQSFDIVVSSVEVNKGIDDSVFEL